MHVRLVLISQFILYCTNIDSICQRVYTTNLFPQKSLKNHQTAMNALFLIWLWNMFLKLILATVCILTTTGLTEFEHLERIIGEDSGYDRRVRPNHGAGPVNIRISIFVLNIPEISFAKHSAEMTVEMYYRQLWHDPRLVDHHDESQIIVGGRDIAERIWVPDTFFENEHSSESKETYLKIENGNIIWSQKMKLTFTKVKILSLQSIVLLFIL